MIEGELINSMIQKIIPKELSAIGRWELIIADEDKKPLKGGFSIIKIREIPVPPNSIVILMNVLKHYSAEVVDLLISDKGSEINAAIVYSVSGKTIRAGEVLGAVKISDTTPKERHKVVEVFWEFSRKLSEIQNEIGDSFIRSQWPMV
ncbi:MAG: DUF22 domain-containing protein [Archaeoglobaceae archaeon]